MKKVFFTLTLFIPIAFLLNCGSSLKSTQQSTESLKPTSVSKTIVVGSDTLTLPSGLTLDTLPAEFSIQTEKVVIEPAWAEYVLTPIQYEWVQGEVKGSYITYPFGKCQIIPKLEKYLYHEAFTELVMTPPLYDEGGTLIKHSSVIERIIPAIYKTLETRRRNCSGEHVQKTVPYEYKDGKTRVPISPPKWIEKTHPAVIKQIETIKVSRIPGLIIRDEMGQILYRTDRGTDGIIDFLKSYKTP